MKFSREQEEIINDNSKYLQIIAGAGSGKTFTIIEMVARKLRENIFNENEILMITFSRKACDEIKKRLNTKIPNNKVKIFTFHAYCLRVLKIYHPEFSKSIKIINPEEKELLLKDILRKERFKVGGIPYEFLLREKNKKLPEFSELLENFSFLYSEIKNKNNSIDYDDMVDIYLKGMINKESWTIDAGKEISYIIVDEFQDTDPIQIEWLQKINPHRLTVVGDDWQAIYGFRGASSLPFLNFSKYFSPLKKLFLTINFRSDREIVQVSEIPIQKNKFNIPKKVISNSKEKGDVKKICITSHEQWRKVLEIAVQKKEFQVLVRTNFRMEKLKKLGFPPENISTIHSSKGLEYDTVFLDLSDGWSKLSKFETIDLEEERRILYVGLSRAKHNLYVVGMKESKAGGIETLFFAYF